MSVSQGAVLALVRPTGDGPSLLKALVAERHWNYSAFAARFRKAAQEVAETDDEPRLAKLGVAERTFANWMSGKVKGLPAPDACRVLERMFGYPVEALFAPASKRPAAPAAPETVAESGGSVQAAPVLPEGLAQLLAASGVAPDAETLATASQLANMLTVAFLAGAQFAAAPRTLKAVA